jgi:hypothetical protein
LAGAGSSHARCKGTCNERVQRVTQSLIDPFASPIKSAVTASRNRFASHHLLQFLALSLCQLQMASCKMRQRILQRWKGVPLVHTSVSSMSARHLQEHGQGHAKKYRVGGGRETNDEARTHQYNSARCVGSGGDVGAERL